MLPNDASLFKVYDSCWELEIISFYQREVSVFAAQQIYVNMRLLNIMLKTRGRGMDIFDCSLVTRDNKHVVRQICVLVEEAETFVKTVPLNSQLALIRIEKLQSDQAPFYKSIAFLYRHRWLTQESWLHFEAPDLPNQQHKGMIKVIEIPINSRDNLFGLKVYQESIYNDSDYDDIGEDEQTEGFMKARLGFMMTQQPDFDSLMAQCRNPAEKDDYTLRAHIPDYFDSDDDY